MDNSLFTQIANDVIVTYRRVNSSLVVASASSIAIKIKLAHDQQLSSNGMDLMVKSAKPLMISLIKFLKF